MGNAFLCFLFYVFVTTSLSGASGCAIEGIDNWLISQSETILDIFSGAIWNRTTTNIEDINFKTFREGLNGGPYVNIVHSDSRLVISTNDDFKNYEEIETAADMGFTINFRCSDGSARNLIFAVNIQDTNNNDPQFQPSNTYEFTIVPPVPPGFRITNCVDDIIVRDIDLTTERIDFNVTGSSLFQIDSDNSSTVAKQFKSILRTTTLIRTISEPIILTVTATDVDRTGDPRRTATATVKIVADTEFQFPDEPVFSQPFYLATYTDHEFILQDSIYLRQGYDDKVIFSFDGDQKEYFELDQGTNNIKFKMVSPLPVGLFREGRILLVVQAERQYTSGATATVILQLPETIELTFEKAVYEGTIVDNELKLDDLKFTQGYENTSINIDIISDYKSYFSTSVEGNTIKLSMVSLSEGIIRDNNFINLQLVATTASNSTATTIITLEIIKDDITTPVFERNLYTGSYDSKTGLNLEQIVLIQGYDSTVTFTLEGEHSTLFEKKQDGANVSLSMTALPTEPLGDILVSLRATKPRTVGAHTVIQVTLPSARELGFEKQIYRGTLEDKVIALETIVLSVGYDSDVIFNLTGDYADYFNISVENNKISLDVKEPIPETALENNILLLTLSASGTNTMSTWVTILLEIIKDDNVTPVFMQHIYEGSYLNSTTIDIELIRLIHGYDDTVTFHLGKENSRFFSIEEVYENHIELTLDTPIPEDLIFDEKVLQFTISAEKPRTVGATSVISISFPRELTEPAILKFTKNTYRGVIENDTLKMENIILESGFTPEITFSLSGDSVLNFAMSNSSNMITIELSDTVSLEDLRKNKFIVLEIEATRERAVPVISTLIIDIPDVEVVSPVFENAFYSGIFTKDSGLEFTETIALKSGFDKTVSFELEGDDSKWFDLKDDENNVLIVVKDEDGLRAITDRNHLIFTITASKTGSNVGRAAVIISLKDATNLTVLGFDQRNYIGTLSNNTLNIENITLTEGYSENVTIAFNGDASGNGSVSFDKILYIGSLKDGIVSHETITISGFTGTRVTLSGELATSFDSSVVDGIVTVKAVTSAVFPVNLSHITLTLQADDAKSVLILDVTRSDASSVSFDKILYTGTLIDGTVSHETITISGFTGTEVTLTGELATSFDSSVVDGIVTVKAVTPAVFPENLSHITLTLQADDAKSVLILDVTRSDISSVSFDKILYTGTLIDGTVSHETITISGFTGTKVTLSGELATLFDSSVVDGIVSVKAVTSAVFPVNLSHITLTLQADDAKSVLILDVTRSDTSSVSFDKILYTGTLIDGTVSHETITISGFTGTEVTLSGELATSFDSSVVDGIVTVKAVTSAVFPANLTHITLTLQADDAKSVLILDVTQSVDPELPTITFNSPSYFLWADTNQTGVVGKAEATVDNGEAVTYSLLTDDDLQERVSINAKGEIKILVTFNAGLYNFKVTATAETSRVSTSAPVLLRVDTLPECTTEDGLPPLIILQRVEEEPHLNLVVLNQTKHKDCRYTLTSLWPQDQSWLYVDNEGLHAKAIDREDKSIAFMISSQIQAELILHCDSYDDSTVVKRSLSTEAGSKLGPNDYGTSKWVLADTINYNARRSVVNLIVEDINDNPPIFVGKEDEPIYVGYPIPELENTILPRALAQLKATDADIGENAELVYWSREDNLAVAPTTGYVYLRDNAILENNSQFTVYATDQNGRGLNGSLDIVVKLLDRNQIAVMTVQNAFLDDESTILSNLSTSVGYDIKVLRTVVISATNEMTSRRKREIPTASGVSLQLFIYGIQSGNQIVTVNKLTSDLDQVVTVNKVQVISLQEHLERLDNCPAPGQYTVLLAATITLAVVLFLVIIAVTVWFLLKWRKKENYEKFSDVNSLGSRIETESIPKVEVVPKPRLDIEELKRSERRLQEMLDAPVPEIATAAIEPHNKVVNREQEDKPPTVSPGVTVVNISDAPEIPIIIQSIDKLKDNNDDSGEDDEFGETKIAPRKSVVTFNENVEKIIHLEYGIEPENDTEIYRF